MRLRGGAQPGRWPGEHRTAFLHRPRLRSLRNKLALVFFAITGLSFSVIYFIVVPQLESNLERRKTDEVARVAALSKPSLQALMGRRSINAKELDRRVRAVADATGSQVTLFGVQQSNGGQARQPSLEVRMYVISDSGEKRVVPENPRLASRAVITRKAQRGTIRFDEERLGQIAQPLTFRKRIDWVAVYSAEFDEVAETVAFVRRRLLIATGLALLLALGGGYLVARALARRVRRLEQAAQEVAAGQFLDPLPVDSRDELGELTKAFNEMQLQLRQVEVARKEFVATASHELRTPIFSLGGFVELLRDEELDEATRREFLDAMAEQTERLQKLAVDLLDLSRLDAGAVELESEGVDLCGLTRAVVGEFRPAVARHGTDLDLQLTAPVRASCDPDRVAQIVRILLDNALRHTPRGTNVTVTTHRDNGTALLTVADEGPGLPDEHQVFDRFYTGEATTGAGLGLTIARELAERMDGSIAPAPTPRGALLVLTLPGEQETGPA